MFVTRPTWLDEAVSTLRTVCVLCLVCGDQREITKVFLSATVPYPDACENITSRFMAQKRIEYWVYMIQVCMWSPTHTINLVVVVVAT